MGAIPENDFLNEFAELCEKHVFNLGADIEFEIQPVVQIATSTKEANIILKGTFLYRCKK